MLTLEAITIVECTIYVQSVYSSHCSPHSWCGGSHPGGGPPLTGGGSSGSGGGGEEEKQKEEGGTQH